MIRWLVAFLLTQLVEIPVYRFGAGAPWWVAAMASTLTHPIVWFVFPLIPGVDYWPMVALAELFAVVAEALWLRLNRVPGGLLWSLAANASSVLVGLTLRALIGYP